MSEGELLSMRDVIQVDAGKRGLATDPTENLLTYCAEDFTATCQSVAQPGTRMLVVTGFPILDAEPPCSETDGPAGALFLARALTPLGIGIVLAADYSCVPALEAGVRACGLQKDVPVIDLASRKGDKFDFVESTFARATGSGPTFTHLLALERVGPSHTCDSIQAQPGCSPETLALFEAEVPPNRRDRPQSMRGIDLTKSINPTHLLFEAAGLRGPAITTIGIGDGGNEIGMGKIPWPIIRRNVNGSAAIACRISTDFLIVAGVSNWGAYGLAAGVRLLRNAPPDPHLFDPERERQLLQLMIDAGPLVDGVTRRREATVDGLPFERHAQVLRELLGATPFV